MSNDADRRLEMAAAAVFTLGSYARARLDSLAGSATTRAYILRRETEAAHTRRVAAAHAVADTRVRDCCVRARAAVEKRTGGSDASSPVAGCSVRIGELSFGPDSVVPLVVPLLGQGNLVVSGGAPGVVGELFAAIVDGVRAVVRSLDVHCFDPAGRGHVRREAHRAPGQFADLIHVLTRARATSAQLLVVLDYPHGMDDDTARALTELMRTGPEDGVSVVLHHDPEHRDSCAGLDFSRPLRGYGNDFVWQACPPGRVRLDPANVTAAASDSRHHCLDYLSELAEIVTIARTRDDEITAADHQLQTGTAALARHLLELDDRERHHRAVIDAQERTAHRLLLSVRRGDLIRNLEPTPPTTALSTEELVRAHEVAVHELRRQVEAQSAPDRTAPA
ncbi:hypothetical protein [Nocardia sp. NPDC050413]|uniref:hypothetical protein n=1 Tax=Nocardia sp. NPDC050413 TaxID=3155784 RepID=UPI0033EE987C